MWPEFVLHQAGGSNARRSQRHGTQPHKVRSPRIVSRERYGDPRRDSDRVSLRTRPPSTRRTRRTSLDGWDPALGVLALPASVGEPGNDEHVGCDTRRSRDPPPNGAGGSSGTAVPVTQATLPRDPTAYALADARFQSLVPRAIMAARGETREALRIRVSARRPSTVDRHSSPLATWRIGHGSSRGAAGRRSRSHLLGLEGFRPSDG